MGKVETSRLGARRGAVPVAHSIVEERLFLLTVRCSCGAGPLVQVRQEIAREPARVLDVIHARCPRCDLRHRFDFDATGFFGRFYPRRSVSDRAEPSELLDRVAWVRWARLYLHAFLEGPATPARRLGPGERIDCGVLALRCLDEAMKFFAAGYASDDDRALHSHGSAEAFREAPERFGRVEVLGLKLQAAMLLAGAGIDPDAADAGEARPPVIAAEALAQISGRPETHTGPATAGAPETRLLAQPARRTTGRTVLLLAALTALVATTLAVAYALAWRPW